MKKEKEKEERKQREGKNEENQFRKDILITLKLWSLEISLKTQKINNCPSNLPVVCVSKKMWGQIVEKRRKIQRRKRSLVSEIL